MTGLILFSAVKVAVLFVADQFKYEYLNRFNKKFISDGFKRLMKDGLVYSDCHHMHVPTYTAVGHATISTGVEPRIHGIYSNYWYSRKEGRMISSVYDKKFGRSPMNLRFPTVGDNLKRIYERSKVISLSLKDRAAIFLGGYSADVVLYLDREGRFTTSDYYRKPKWLKEFNRTLKGKDKIFKGNSALFELFKMALKEENIGEDEYPDLVMLSFSSLDLAGHRYGPESKEVERLVLQLDTIISKTLKLLDKEFGKGNYLFVFTSDHGVAPTPKDLGGYFYPNKLKDSLNSIMKKIFKKDSLVLFVSSHLIYLNYDKMEGLDSKMVMDTLKSVMMRLKEVLKVYTSYDLKNMIPKDFVDSLVLNGYFEGSDVDMIYILKPYWLYTYGNVKANHGSPYFYDTHVPLVFYGLWKGRVDSRCSITLVAKKLMEALGIY